MCGRYYISDEDMEEELLLILDTLKQRADPEIKLKTRGEIFPTDVVPALANNRALVKTPFAMRWGFDMNGKSIINARSETASEKPMFADGMQQRRCLIPASFYFEWEKRDTGKIKYAIKPAKAKVIYMAGIYRIRAGAPEMVILTKDASEDVAFIHDRMPVMLPAEVRLDWLNPKYDGRELLSAAETHMEYCVMS